jgi:hypothetical protein
LSQDLVPAGPGLLTAIVCQGRALVAGQSTGPPCGTTIHTRGPASLLDQARAAGWRVGRRADGTPDAMCPKCARPDQATRELCAALERSVRRGW